MQPDNSHRRLRELQDIAALMTSNPSEASRRLQALNAPPVATPAQAIPTPHGHGEVAVSTLLAIEGFIKRALPEADYAAMRDYVERGAPGFKALTESDVLYPIMQLLWETIREHQPPSE